MEPGKLVFPLRDFRSSLSAEFWRNCILNDGTQQRALLCDQNEKIIIYYWKSNPQPVAYRIWPRINYKYYFNYTTINLALGIQQYLVA